MSGAGSSLDCVIARRQADKYMAGVVFLTPVKGKKAEAAAIAAGVERAEDLATLRVEGSDQPGIGARMARAVADVGVNMRGCSAMRSGKNFVAYIGFDSDADADRAAKALKSVGGRSAPRKRAMARA
jgi:predicted amino acid-binding ACT domain protein